MDVLEQWLALGVSTPRWVKIEGGEKGVRAHAMVGDGGAGASLQKTKWFDGLAEALAELDDLMASEAGALLSASDGEDDGEDDEDDDEDDDE